MRPARASVALGLATAGLATLTGCGGGSSPVASPPGVRTPPSIAAFLKGPVATPSVCPSNQSGSSDGRSSPWVNHVDVSVFLKPSASRQAAGKIGTALRQSPIVERTYFESQAEAYAEFQRLYTCWARVPRSQTPASYRVVLTPTATIAARNTLVARMLRNPTVDSASCDPALPCTNVVRSVTSKRR